MSDYRKKLIEVALPLDKINEQSAREKSIRHGHPSTLHLWWARRPLAACRAVLFAQLVDDPSAHPERFPDEAAQDAERQRLFEIIEELVRWESSTNEAVLAEARAEIVRSCGGNPPPILDPFAGGGSIPLEAQRLGLEAHASDLNPVAVLINKALIEIPPRFAGRAPVHPKADNRATWRGAEGLAEDVRRYGQWMRDEAEARVGHLYPKATLPNGEPATVIAWIWARTVTCPNPACRATMPLVRSFWLGKKKGKEAWVRPVVEGKAVRFEIAHDKAGPAVEGTVDRQGATCLVCQQPVKLDHIRAEGRAGRMGATLMAIAAEGDRRREYLPPTPQHVAAADVERPAGTPVSELPERALSFRVQAYGMTQHADLFTNRQLTALVTFSELVGEARAQAEADALAAGHSADDAESYANAIATYLALGVSRTTDQLNSLSRWSPSRDQSIGLFARHAIPMVWDSPEVNPFGGAAGDLEVSLASVARVIGHLPAGPTGTARMRDARSPDAHGCIATDPPYYDNIGYADLSDFFYVWLRLSLRDVYPEHFGTMVTPKSAELIATPYRHDGSKEAAERYFEDGFVEVFASARRVHPTSYPLSLFYAFKQSESSGDEGIASTGWATMLEGLLVAGWMVTATWPMRTERDARSIAAGTNSLASSVVLACRPRPDTAGVTDRQGLVRNLREELPAALKDLEKASIAPVDLRQAAIGPGMAVFSRFARVVEPDGSAMRVRTALGLINQVLDAVLSEQEVDLDAETRWAIVWFSQHFFDAGKYGEAESLSVAMNVSVPGMQHSGILRSGGGNVQLLAPGELRDDWDPTTDTRRPIWEATHHLVRRLEEGGESSAAALLAQLGGVADSCRVLAYRLYTICEKPRPALAGPYNALAASWTEMQRLGQAAPVTPAVAPEQQSFDVGQS